jgi:hypothetical protein
MEHSIIIHKRNRGGSPIKGMRGTSGTDAKCTCGGWKDFTNEAPPSRSQAWQKRAFNRHLEAVTLEGDIERGTAQLTQANAKLAEMLAEGDLLPSFVEAQTAKIARIGKELAADLTEQRYGKRDALKEG